MYNYAHDHDDIKIYAKTENITRAKISIKQNQG